MLVSSFVLMISRRSSVIDSNIMYSGGTVRLQWGYSINYLAVISLSSFYGNMFVSSFVLMISRRSSVIDSSIMYSRGTVRVQRVTLEKQYLYLAVRSFSREMFVFSFVLMISRRSSVTDSNIMYSGGTLGYSKVQWDTVGIQFLYLAVRSSVSFSREMFIPSVVLMISQ